MRCAVTILLVCIAFGFCPGQSSNISSIFKSPYERGMIQYEKQAYRYALELFLYAAEKDSLNLEILEHIAECQLRLGRTSEAEHSYAILANTPGSENRYKYQYGQILSIQKKYEEAQVWFAKYIEADPSNTATEKRDFLKSWRHYYRDSLLYEIKDLEINSDQSDFSPRYYKDGLVFVSARNRDMFIQRRSTSALNDEEALLNIFFSTLDTLSLVVPFDENSFNTPYHDGPVSFFDNGRQLIFTRTNSSGNHLVKDASGKANLKLFTARVGTERQILKISALPFNDDSYSVSHPWISNDGNLLLFASDMPGGFGGSDLYLSRQTDGKWITPENLGPAVNTLGNEGFPYMVNDSTLYFASDGHGGLGGLDVYMSYSRDGGFTYPTNLGYPINSSMDDFALIVDDTGRAGYFSSNRPGGKGYDDIYSFTAKSFFLVALVVDRNDSTIWIPDANVEITDGKGGRKKLTTDNRGYFQCDLSFDARYTFSLSRKGYSWIDSLTYSTFTRSIGVDTLLIALWKHDLFATGVVYSNETQLPLAGARVTIENLTDGISESTVTDSTGSYRFLVHPDKKYLVQATKDEFVEEGYRLNTKGLQKGLLVNDILLEEVFLEKGLVTFDFDKYDLKPEFIEELDQLVRTLTRNPTFTLSVAAYADSRGTVQYNQSLSDKRAATIRTYFESQGIKHARIEAIGFGEQLLLNRCSDGVECTEEEHSKNRRAEIKVQTRPVN